jgi:hypothetical protein
MTTLSAPMRLALLTAAAATAAALATPAQAVTLVQGSDTALPGTTAAAEPQLAGVIIEDWLQPFSYAAYGGTVSGNVQSRVVRSSGDGTLDFYWRVLVDEQAAGPVASLRLGHFVAPEYDANWRIDGLGSEAPYAAHLFDASTGFVNFKFHAVQPGESSNFVFFDSSATAYAKTAIYDLTALGTEGISTSYQTFAPAVPEPASYTMLALGLAAFGLAMRRQRPL